MAFVTYKKLQQAETAGKVVLDYFVYTASLASLGVGASLSTVVNIENDSSFILDKMAYMVDIAGAAQTESTKIIPLVTVAIQDSGSGRLLQSSAVPISAIAGNGELPFVLPQPRVFTANSTISFTFANESAAEVYRNLRLMLIGRKVFDY